MAATNKRPGGLTTLAVVNFILAAFSVLGILGLAVMLVMPRMDNPNITPQQQAQIDAMMNTGTTTFILLIVVPTVIGTVLLLLSGVGYLKLRKFLGRTLGNTYAVFSILTRIPIMLRASVVLGGGFRLTSLINLIYPVLTLILLNTVFKDDFVN